MPHPRREEGLREVEFRALNILRQTDHDGAGFHGIGKNTHGLRKGGQQLGWMSDAVEIAADRTEAVVGGDVPLYRMLDLLQHRITKTVVDDVGREQKHGGGGWWLPSRPPETMLVDPGPAEAVHARVAARLEAFAKPMAAWTMDCSFLPW